MAQDIKDASRLAKKVLDCACGKESLTQEEAAYLKKLDENDETIVDELFIRSLLEALLKLEKFKVSKKRHENVSKGPQKVSHIFEYFFFHLTVCQVDCTATRIVRIIYSARKLRQRVRRALENCSFIYRNC